MRTSRLVFALLLAVSVTSIGGALYWQLKILSLPEVRPLRDTEDVSIMTAQLGQYMVLPEDEVPTMATVRDREALKDQPFFEHAKNGDKVLIYTKAKKAILYRPQIQKIIDSTPVYISDTLPEGAVVAPPGGPSSQSDIVTFSAE